VDKATASSLETALAKTQGALDALIAVIRVCETTDSMDILFYMLRVVNCIVEKLPTICPVLRTRGVLRWVERMSNSAVVRQDVQAGLITSKSGRIKDKHISKLASDITAKAWPHSSSALANTRLAQVCAALANGDDAALEELARVLTQDSIGISVHDMVTCDLASALMTYLNRPGDKHWTNFDQSFSGSWAQKDKIDALVRPLVHYISTEESWPVNATGR
jgi:hypothetical protein